MARLIEEVMAVHTVKEPLLVEDLSIRAPEALQHRVEHPHLKVFLNKVVVGPLEARQVEEEQQQLVVTPLLPMPTPVAEVPVPLPVLTEGEDPLIVVVPERRTEVVMRTVHTPKVQLILTVRGVAEGHLVVASGAEEATFPRRISLVAAAVLLLTVGVVDPQTVGVVDLQTEDVVEDPEGIEEGVEEEAVHVVVGVMAMEEEGVAMVVVTNPTTITVAVTRMRKHTKKGTRTLKPTSKLKKNGMSLMQ